LLPETGRKFAFPLDKSEKRSDRGGSTTYRNQRTFGQKNPEKYECGIKDQSGSRGILTLSPHTTPHAGSHGAGHEDHRAVAGYWILDSADLMTCSGLEPFEFGVLKVLFIILFEDSLCCHGGITSHVFKFPCAGTLAMLDAKEMMTMVIQNQQQGPYTKFPAFFCLHKEASDG